jgi:CheY-like chemotaxis protein
MQTSPQTRLHLLLADDNKEDRYFFERALKQLPIAHHLSTVPDGERLMAYLYKNTRSLPDAVFIDLDITRKTGMECLAEIRAYKKLSRLPVIIYSNALKEGVEDILFEKGATYYLSKCNSPELAKRIEQILFMLTLNTNQPARETFVFDLQKCESPVRDNEGV